ncbi:MAG: hypothetical protein K8T10_05385 [Candidatus Eremiobacteraeota bacterium]|nr:hypothetical protein [Candidatus Eremiobacteraeota bacterium]
MEESIILQKIRDLRRRYRFTAGLRTLCISLLFGIIAASFYILFVKITGLYLEFYYFFAIPICVSVIAGLIYHFTRKVSLMEISLKSDEVLRLKEKLSTALEWIEDNRVRTPMFRALLRDTAREAEKISTPDVFPYIWKKQVKRLSVATVLLVAFIWIPPLSLIKPKVDPKVVKTIHTEAKKIENAARKLDKKKPRTPASLKHLKKSSQDMKKLSKELSKSDITKRKALAKISKVKDTLAKEMQKKEELEKMEEQLRRSLMSGKSEQKESEKSAFNRLSRKMQEIAKKLKQGNLSDAERKKLVKKLEKIKLAMKKAGMKTDNIEKAMNDIKKGQCDKAAKSLTQAADQFQQRQRELEDMQGLQDMARQLQDSKNMISGRQLSDGLPKRKMRVINGKFPADFGRSSTNKERKPDGEFDNKYTKRHSDKSPDMKSIYERLYKPERDEFKKGTGKVRGKLSDGPVIKSLRTKKRGAPRIGDKARVGAEERYAKYRTIGESALKREKIPAQYKDLIRNYYDDIKPGKE